MSKTITDYKIKDYGIDSAQYFQGHGTSFTKYDECTLGAGDTYREALEDALDQAAMNGYEIELTQEELALNSESVEDYHSRYCKEEDHSDCNHELSYYVGLLWNA